MKWFTLDGLYRLMAERHYWTLLEWFYHAKSPGRSVHKVVGKIKTWARHNFGNANSERKESSNFSLDKRVRNNDYNTCSPKKAYGSMERRIQKTLDWKPALYGDNKKENRSNCCRDGTINCKCAKLPINTSISSL